MKNTHEISTGKIFASLIDVSESKWKNYDRNFLSETFQDALENTLWTKGIVTVKYDGKNGKYLNNCTYDKYDKALERAKDMNEFPFPNYFLVQDDNSAHMNVVSYTEECIIQFTDAHFDLFFALQFSLTEIVKGNELPASKFLNYHLKNTFENNKVKFKRYLESIYLKYKEIIKNGHETILQQFLESIKQKKSNQKTVAPEAKIEKLKWRGKAAQLGYLFIELSKNGFIVLPSTNGKESFAKLGKILFEMFELENPTTPENLIKEVNPEKNTLSDDVRNKFSIPDKASIS